MDSKTAIPLVAAIVVVVAVIASAAFVVNGGNEGNSYDYTIYTEVNGDDGITVSTKEITFSTTEKNNTQFIKEANKAFDKAGLEVTVSESSYGISISYDGSGNNATFFKSGSDWKAVSETSTQYCSNQELYFILGNGYISEDVYEALTASETPRYSETGWGGAYAYIKHPGNIYTINYDIIEADGTTSGSGTLDVYSETSELEGYMSAVNAGFSDLGVKVTFAKSTYGVNITYNGSGNNSTFYFDNATSTWQAVSDTATQYSGNALIQLELGNGYISADTYNALGAEDQITYYHTGWGGAYDYQKTPYYNYSVRYDVIGTDGKATSSDSIAFSIMEKTNAAYSAAATAAFKKANLNVTYSDSMWISYDGGSNNATFYYDCKTSAWTAVSDPSKDYLGNAVSSLELGNGYISADTYKALDSENQIMYTYTGWGGAYDYQRTPYCNYKVMYDVVGADGKVTSYGSVTFITLEKTNAAYSAAASAAFKTAGLNVTYSDSMWISYDGGSNNATYYYDCGTSAWVAVANPATEYIGNAVSSLELGNGYISKTVYDALSTEEQAGFSYTGWGGAYDYVKIARAL